MNNCQLFTDQTVKQGGFSDVRTTDNGNSQHYIFSLFIRNNFSIFSSKQNIALSRNRCGVEIFLGGVAVIVETLTDNKNRTVSEVRHYLDKYGKGMGANGCVAWQFDKKGFLAVDGEGLDEETVMMQALEAGASDFQVEDGVFEIYTEPDDFDTVKENLLAQGLTFLEAEVQMIPQTYTKLTDEEDIKNMEKMLEIMEENDDIQAVWHNWDND